MFFDVPTFSGGKSGLRCVVAIPAKDEADRIVACLGALAAQRRQSGAPLPPGLFEVVLLANNCGDGTPALARRIAPRLPYALHVVEASLPPCLSHAGEARARAMDLALARLSSTLVDSTPVLLTTDADSCVGPVWIDRNLAEIDAGADVVLGRLALDDDGRSLPEALHRRGALEAEYELLLTELSAVVDPLPWNPWPHHATVSGASIAVTAEAYRAIGGAPRLPLGEDKALVAHLLMHDAKIRYSNDIEVVTSARLHGRAPGGVADTLRLRAEHPDAVCDAALEPYRVAKLRAGARGRLRRLWPFRERRPDLGAWGEYLGLTRELEGRIADAATFGRAWRIAEAASPRLFRRALYPDELPRETAEARADLARLEIGAVIGDEAPATYSLADMLS
jgi:hypothetical protein